MNISPVPNNALKADELKALRKIASLFGDQTYIASFFTESLFGWLEGQMNNDFGCDLFSAYLSALNQLNEQLGETNKAETHASNVESQLAHAKQVNDNLRTMINNSEAHARTLGLKNDEVYSQLDEAWARIETLTAEVIRLKAEIYDLSHR